jgi:uroporphyrinogen-III synthase
VSGQILILRPEPGASESAARARSLGLEPIVAPLFVVRPLAWELPSGPFDAVLLTSANAARHGGSELERLTSLRCYAVGERTGAAAAAAGFTAVTIGPADGVPAMALMADAGVGRALHLCGRDHIPLIHPRIEMERRIVYVSEPAGGLPEEALARDPLILVHSPRAAARLAALVGHRRDLRLAAISPVAAEAAGEGWAEVHVAAAPRDQALLELAAKLCQTAGPTGRDLRE